MKKISVAGLLSASVLSLAGLGAGVASTSTVSHHHLPVVKHGNVNPGVKSAPRAYNAIHPVRPL